MRLFAIVVSLAYCAVAVYGWPGVFNGAHLLGVIFIAVSLFGFRKPETRNEEKK